MNTKDRLYYVMPSNGKVRFCFNYDTLSNRKHRTIGTVKGAVKVLNEFQTIPEPFNTVTLKDDNDSQNLFDRAVNIFNKTNKERA